MKTFISSELMNWNQVHFHHTCNTFSWCAELSCFPQGLTLFRLTCLMNTHITDIFGAEGLSWVCSVGLKGPAALSMRCVCVCVYKECVYLFESVCVHAFACFGALLFLSLFLCPAQNACHFPISLCMHSITL